MTGESTSRSSEMGLNVTVLPDCVSTGRDVPNFQPSGRISLASKVCSVARRAGGIEHDVVPFENGELVGGGVTVGLDEVERGVELADTGRDVDVEGEGVEECRAPRE